MTKFSELNLNPKVLKAVEEAGYDTPTPIQAGAIPPALEGRDVLGIAQTGTGKTASFTLPMITLLARGRARARMPRSLVLCPTRELAAQVAENFDTYAKHVKLTKALLIGGVSFKEQDALIDKGVDVLIATPGRLLDHFERGKLLLTGVQVMVVDEADRMLDMGFIPDIERIFSLTPFTRQTLFFSATMASEIERITNTFLSGPARIEVARQASASETIEQGVVKFKASRRDREGTEKRNLLRALIDGEGERCTNAIVFCNRKSDVDIVAKSLKKHGYDAAPIHGDLDQSQRTRTLDGFRDGSLKFLIASDVAGSNAKSMRLDQENRSWNHLAQRNATSIFLHSFAADEGERGIDLPFVKLDVARPDTTFPLITEVLNEQEQELWYLNTRNGQEYYFSNVPNLNRMVVDKKGQIQSSDVRSKLESLIRDELGTRMRTYLWPSSGDKLPDNEELKLAVLDPSENYTEQELRRWVNRSGQSYRSYKNTIFFAQADEDRYGRIQDDIKDFLALQDILNGIRQGKHSGLEEKENEVQRRLENIKGEFSQKIRDLYHVALVPVMNGDSLEEIDFGQSATGRENLDSWFRKKLTSTKHSKILERPPSANLINKKFLGNSDTIELQAILDQFYKDPNLPALDQADLIAETVANGVQDVSFGLARREDGELEPTSVRINEPLTPSQVNFREEGWVLVTDEKAVELQSQVQTEPAGDEEEEDSQPTGSAPSGTGSSGGSPSPSGNGAPGGSPSGSPDEEEETLVHRFSLRASDIPTRKLTDLNRGVLMPITRDVGEFTFTIEFEVESADGISERKIEQQVMETLRQLGATVERKDTG